MIDHNANSTIFVLYFFFNFVFCYFNVRTIVFFLFLIETLLYQGIGLTYILYNNFFIHKPLTMII